MLHSMISSKAPRTLDDWTLEAVQGLLASGHKEDSFFDFKITLPDPRNDYEKEKLRRDFCAFANSYGGFLVIGVCDSKYEVVGVDINEELIPRINDFQKEIFPSVGYDFKTIAISNEKILYVIYIPRSTTGPHAVKKGDAFVFPIRMPGSNTAMTYEEVRMSFMISNEKLAKLQMLVTQLISLGYFAEKSIVKESEMESAVQCVALDRTLLNLALSDAYALISSDPMIIGYLSEINNACSMLNFKAQVFCMAPATSGTVVKHNEFMNKGCLKVVGCCEQAVDRIKNSPAWSGIVGR